MKTTINLLESALAAEIAEARVDTLVGCLLRVHATFGSDNQMFEMLERDLLADQPVNIRYEAESRFYEATREDHGVSHRAVNPAWNLD